MKNSCVRKRSIVENKNETEWFHPLKFAWKSILVIACVTMFAWLAPMTYAYPGSGSEAAAVPYAADAPSGVDLREDVPAKPADDEEANMVAMISPTALPVSDGSNRQVRVPILMYHYISDPPRGADEIRRGLSLPGPDFELQLRYLVNEGYQSVTMQDLIMHIQQGVPLPEKPILLTFDDGYRDAFTVAFPLLKKYGFTGVFFVFTKPINEENREYLSWQEVELMSAAGMEIGSHGYNHFDLRELSDEAMQKELVESKKEIEAHIQRPVLFFCYPAGAYNNRVVQEVAEAGYWAAVTTQQGALHSGDSRLVLQRVRVRGEAGLERFDAMLNWDW